MSLKIESLEALRQLYAQPHERAVRKQIPALDPHDIDACSTDTGPKRRSTR